MKKRKDGRYAKQVTVGIKDGKPVKKTVYGKTIKEVEKNYRDMMLLIDKGVVLDSDNITVAELWDEWFRIKKSNVIKEQSKDSYITVYRHVIPQIGNVKVKKITQFAIESLLNPFISNGNYSTAHHLLNTLKAMFNYAIENSIIYINPCNNIKVKYVPNKRRALSEFEKALIERSELPPKEKTFISILRYTGMRRNEVLALQKKDIDLKNRIIYINKTLVDERGKAKLKESTKTESGNRTIPIFEPLYPILEDYITDKESEEMLFLNRRGTYISSKSVDYMMKKVRKITGLKDDVTCHTFRHTFISECYVAGVDTLRLQYWVGHSDISTTLKVYTHLEKKVLLSGNIMDNFYCNRKSNGSQDVNKTKKIL